jgi:hypothetical protein
MIKLKDILFEGLNKKEIQAIVDRVYPQIIKDLGSAKKGTPKVEFHNNVLSFNSGIEDYPGDEHEGDHAQYVWGKNIIAIFKIAMKSEKDVIQALLHEYTHATQDEKKMKEYRKLGYAKNPYEKAAHKAEKNWKKYI